MNLGAKFDNSYARLPAQLFTPLAPTPVAAPKLIRFNGDLARELGITTSDDAQLAQIFAGNVAPDGAAPLAQAYGGHQFGNWNPGLGDGRALLLGEVIDSHGQRRDIALKGSGRTPYSRSGDGRAALGPVLREYLVSEAMHAMGVPTTRALAAVLTGEQVWRETALPGAVLTRVAASHIRVGTFQLAAARGDLAGLKALADHVIARHYPDATGPEGLLAAITARQAELIAQWMALGFIHGVMNTDNMAVSGETIDYGPCAFMDLFDPLTVLSSIDHGGRYAWRNQPDIAVWNLAQLATALIPLMPDRDAAVESFTNIINGFAEHYLLAWRRRFGAKIGLAEPTEADQALMSRLLGLMAQDGADFTNAFAALAGDKAQDQFTDRAAFADWRRDWQARVPDPALMARANPQVIPRTHLIEAAISAAIAGDLAPFHAMLEVVTDPFAPLTGARAPYARPPAEDERVLRTFCGT